MKHKAYPDGYQSFVYHIMQKDLVQWQYLLLLFHVGTSNTARSSQRSTKDYRAVINTLKQRQFSHQSSQLKVKGLEGPVESGESINGYRTVPHIEVCLYRPWSSLWKSRSAGALLVFIYQRRGRVSLDTGLPNWWRGLWTIVARKAPERRGGMAFVTGVLEWKDTGSSGRTGKAERRVYHSPHQWPAWSSTWGWMRSWELIKRRAGTGVSIGGVCFT